jgi:hypothetical protein
MPGRSMAGRGSLEPAMSVRFAPRQPTNVEPFCGCERNLVILEVIPRSGRAEGSPQQFKGGSYNGITHGLQPCNASSILAPPTKMRLVNSTAECWFEMPVDTVQFRDEPPCRGVA